MDDDNVLRFEPRDRDDRQWSTSELDGGGPGEPGTGWPDGGGYAGYEAPAEPSLGDLTQVVFLGGQLLDVGRRPIEGSGYEHEVRELEGLGLRWRPGPAAPPMPPPRPAPHEQQLSWLAAIVGGEGALAGLDSVPLPPAPLDLEAVPPHLRDRVATIEARFEPWVALVMGDEGLTAARRLLARAVATEPGLLRSDRDDMAVGAVVWAVAKGNDLVGANRPVRASAIQELAGLRSSPGQRGAAFAHAVGGVASRYGRADWMYGCQPDVIPLGSPDLLVGRFRQRLIAIRDLALQLRARTPAAG
jgi:hypothetical protein